MSQKNEVRERKCRKCLAFIKGTAADIVKHVGTAECRAAFEAVGYKGQRTPLVVDGGPLIVTP